MRPIVNLREEKFLQIIWPIDLFYNSYQKYIKYFSNNCIWKRIIDKLILTRFILNILRKISEGTIYQFVMNSIKYLKAITGKMCLLMEVFTTPVISSDLCHWNSYGLSHPFVSLINRLPLVTFLRACFFQHNVNRKVVYTLNSHDNLKTINNIILLLPFSLYKFFWMYKIFSVFDYLY